MALSKSRRVTTILSSMSLALDPRQVRPYYDAAGDGLVQVSFTLPLEGSLAERAAQETLKRMNLTDVSLVERRKISPGFTFFIAFGRLTFSVDSTQLEETEEFHPQLEKHDLDVLVRERVGRKLVLVGATLESDAHTVGLDAILNVKGFAGHSGLEAYSSFRILNLGAQVPFAQVVQTVRSERADALLISQTITQKGLHLRNLTRMLDILEAEGLRDRLIVIVGGPSVTPELAKELGYDAGFGRGTLPGTVASYVVGEFLRRSELHDGDTK